MGYYLTNFNKSLTINICLYRIHCIPLLYNRETLVKLSNVMKLFDKIESHPLVEQFYQDSDGYWASLVDGYTLQGATQVHEETLTGVWASLKEVCTMEEWETRWNAE